MRQAIARTAASALLALAAAWANAQTGDWGDLAIVSGTLGNQSNRVCVGAPDAMRPADFGCPTYSMYVSTGGLVGINTNNPNANLDVYGTISATNFIGDGSGLTGVIAGSSDRIVSGSTGGTRMVAISDTGYISITQAGANSGWFDPYRGLVTLGVSSTGPISGTRGYFSGNVGIGTTDPIYSLDVQSLGGTILRVLGHNNSPAAILNLTDNTGGAAWNIENGRVSGSLGFYLAGALGGPVTADRTKLIINSSGRVGINTLSPTATLQVSGSLIVSVTGQDTKPTLFVGENGRVGVGTSSPSRKFVVGDANPIVGLKRISSSVDDGLGWAVWGNSAQTNDLYFSEYTTADWTSSSNRMILKKGGNVGISTTSPLAKLDVVGTISASDAIQVGTSSLTCGAGIPGAIRYNAGSLQYCNGTSWSTLGASGGGQEDRIVSGSTNAIAWQDRSLTITTAGTQRMIVGENGNVGIGTSTPGAVMLDVAHSYPTIRLTDADAGSLGAVSGRVEFTDGSGNIAGVVGPQGNSTELVLRNLSGGRVVLTPGSTPVLSALNNGRVGIGLNVITPTATLQVSGSLIVSTSTQTTTPSLYVGTDGRIGIGTSNPQQKLDVFNDAASSARIRIGNTEGSFDVIGDNGDLRVFASGTTPVLDLFDDTSATFYGRVGIGTSAPGSSLTVVGEAQVGSSGAACVTAANAGAIRYSGGTLYYCNASNTWAALGTSTGVTGTGSATAVAYWSGASGLAYDSDGFYWDATNNRLGIGTNAPATALHISSTGYVKLYDVGAMRMYRPVSISSNVLLDLASDYLGSDVPVFTVRGDGRVGIGTGASIPNATLQVSGSFIVSTSAQNTTPTLVAYESGTVSLGTTSNTAGSVAQLFVGRRTGRYGLIISNIDGATQSDMILHNPANAADAKSVQFVNHSASGGRFHIRSLYDAQVVRHNFLTADLVSGSVGISNTSPLAKLDVVGTISATDAVQVGASSLACSSGIPGAIRYNGGNLQYCNGAAWTTLGAGGGGGLDDRIISGTLAMTANSATSYVSLSTAGTTWGYFSSGNSYLPTITASKVSSTNISGSLIQVGNTGAACTAGISGSIRYSSISSTLEYCNSTAWVSVGPSGTLPISFRVDKNGTNQTVTTYTYTNLTWSREVFDTNNNFASNRFTATVPGIYLFTLSAYCEASTNGCQTQIKKNGSGVATDATVGGPNGQTSQVTTLIELAIGDYVEASAANMGATLIGGSPVLTYFTGALLNASSGGGGASVLDDLTDVDTSGASTGSIIAYNGSNWVVSNSGAGVAALASLTDVQLTNLAGRDYLRYDSVSSKWVNISESAVMSTTTMVNGWPDAIQCTAATGMIVTLYLAGSPDTDGRYYYYEPGSNGSSYYIGFNSNGSYYAQNTRDYTNCKSSIATISAAGRAFNFIGNANTGGTALGDRITSGTLAMVANSETSYVSLSTAGTTWGYLSSLFSYLPNLSTNTVSATGVLVKGVYAAKGLFTKDDAESVAFIKTGNGTVSVKAGTVVEVNNTLINFQSATPVSMPALAAGTDYAIYACGDGTAVADGNLSSTSNCTGGSRKIGGFHYAPGGNATGTSGGDTTPQINEYSFWDVKWRPACKDPRGMTLVNDSFWVDIYLTGVDHHVNGTSKYNVTIADGGSPPKIPAAFGGNGTTTYATFTWYEANEVMQSHGKELLSQGEFAAMAQGTTEASSGGTDPVSTILREAYTSKYGVMLSTGNLGVWGRDFSTRVDGDTTTWAWKTIPGGKGNAYTQGTYGLVAARLGGSWGNAAVSGSRAADWASYPWASNSSLGARGRCDHVRLE